MNSFADVHEPERQRLPFRESLLAMLGIAFVTMLVALDQTIVGTAMPRIVAELKGSDLYAWVATSYMLASVITIPIFGRQGDLYGRKLFCSRPSCCSRWRPCYADPRAACCFSSLHAVCRASAAVSCSARYSPPSPISFPIRSCVFALARARHVDIRRSAPRSRARCSGISTRNVHRPLDSYQATQWLKSFASPDLLIDRAEQSALIERLVAAGQPGDAMTHSARMALVASIHVGLVVAAMAAFVGLCLAWFVPAVRVVYGDAKQQGV
jgi:hypothetical protein